MDGKLGKSSIVLLGLGHTNAHIVRKWGMSPIPDAQLICISNSDHATYSGMLPGTLAGLYPKGRMTIDLVRLCASAGACFIRAEVVGLDLDDHRVLLNSRPPIAFDLLSVGIGSIPVGMEKVSTTTCTH